MVKSKRKLTELQPTCHQCGSAVETIWLIDGTPMRVEPKPIEVYFTNQARASGRPDSGWIKHVCKKGNKK